MLVDNPWLRLQLAKGTRFNARLLQQGPSKVPAWNRKVYGPASLARHTRVWYSKSVCKARWHQCEAECRGQGVHTTGYWYDAVPCKDSVYHYATDTQYYIIRPGSHSLGKRRFGPTSTPNKSWDHQLWNLGSFIQIPSAVVGNWTMVWRVRAQGTNLCTTVLYVNVVQYIGP